MNQQIDLTITEYGTGAISGYDGHSIEAAAQKFLSIVRRESGEWDIEGYEITVSIEGLTDEEAYDYLWEIAMKIENDAPEFEEEDDDELAGTSGLPSLKNQPVYSLVSEYTGAGEITLWDAQTTVQRWNGSEAWSSAAVTDYANFNLIQRGSNLIVEVSLSGTPIAEIEDDETYNNIADEIRAWVARGNWRSVGDDVWEHTLAIKDE